MGKWFEIFKTQKDLEQSIPKVNVEGANQTNQSGSLLDNKKVEISYTVLLFCAMMFAVMFIIVYLAGYTHGETDKLTNLFTISGKVETLSKAKGNLLGNNDSKKDTVPEVDNKVELKKELMNEKVVSLVSSTAVSFVVELYYGKSRPEVKFLEGLRKIVKNVLNMDIDSKYIKKDKIFYIILAPLNTESEANKVIELLKAKKMISKNNGKVKSAREVALGSIEGTH